MPDGYRRGGQVTRGGRTFYRRGSRIEPRAALAVGAVSLVGLAAVTGAGTAGMSWLLPAAAVVGVGYLCWRHRCRLARWSGRAAVWAGRRYAKRNHATMLLAAAPKVVAAVRSEPVRRPLVEPTRARRPHQPSLDV